MINKSTKLWGNYIAGGAISIIIFYLVYLQVSQRLATVEAGAWQHTASNGWLVAGVIFMVINVLLEGTKWFLLTGSAAEVTYPKALGSYLAGIATGLITPNRIGDYPARILYLGAGNTFRFINVSILGVVAQLTAIFLFGLGGLIYYAISFPSSVAYAVLAACALGLAVLLLVYLRFTAWLPLLQRIKMLRKLAIYGRLIGRFPASKQLWVLGLSVLRFSVFTAQYLFLLKWMNVDMPLADGFWTAALFFWAMAVIPSIAFTGVALRAKLGIFLFGHFSANVVGIIAATVGIWFLNLVLPAIAGCILMIRKRIMPWIKKREWQTF
jgi:hypothetical protein